MNTTSNTVNEDIFACINFRELDKISDFALIKIRIFTITDTSIIKLIFALYTMCTCSRIFEKRERVYSAKISTFTLC